MSGARMNRYEAIRLMRQLLAGGFPAEAEDDAINALKKGLGCLHVVTLIYHTTPQLSAEEIVDRVAACAPFVAGANAGDLVPGLHPDHGTTVPMPG